MRRSSPLSICSFDPLLTGCIFSDPDQPLYSWDSRGSYHNYSSVNTDAASSFLVTPEEHWIESKFGIT